MNPLKLSCSAAVCLTLATAAFAEELPVDIEAVGLTGRTIHVAPDGDDAADGSEGSPMKTLQAAADAVEPGDTVLVRGGVYEDVDDVIPLQITKGGTEDNWVRFAAYPGEVATIDFDALRGIEVQGADYVVIEGFEVVGPSADVDPEAATEHAEGYKGDTHTPTHFFSVGIRISTPNDDPDNYSHHVIVRDNRIRDTSGGGIATARADYLLIEDNHVTGTSFYTPWGGSGISVWQSTNHDDRTDVYRTVVRGNTSAYNDNKVKFWMIGKFSDGNGIIIDALRNTQPELLSGAEPTPYSGRVLVADNLCHDNGGRGINLYESDNIDIFRNTLRNNARRDNIQQEVEFGRSENVVLRHNLIVPADDRRAFGGYEYDDLTFEENLILGGKKNGGFKLKGNTVAAE